MTATRGRLRSASWRTRWLLRGCVVATVLVGAPVAAQAPAARGAALPTLYVAYGANCAFQITTDSGATLTTGTVLPPGVYQVLPTSSVNYTELANPPCIPQFEITGSDLAVSVPFSSFGSATEITLQPSSSYVAFDAYAPSIQTSFATAATGSSSSLVPTQTTTVPSNPKTSPEDPLGSALDTPSYRGTLTAAVAANGSLALRFKGKQVTTLKPGRYTLVAIDHSHRVSLVLRQGDRPPTTVAPPGASGKHAVSVTLTKGRWSFSLSISGAKDSFLVTGA